MPDELPAVNPSVEREDLAQGALGALEHEAVLFGPRLEELADVLAIRGVQDHADNLARRGGEGWVCVHDTTIHVERSPDLIGRKGVTRA
jgi:hypothetical protein